MIGFTIMTLIASGALIAYAKTRYDLSLALAKIERLEKH